MDKSGNLWVGFRNVLTSRYVNDMWKFAPDYCNCVQLFCLNMEVKASSPSICTGDSVTFTATG